MTEVMTLTTNAQHGHDSSHGPAKIQHAQKPAHVDKVHARLTHEHVEVITVNVLQLMFTPAAC